MSVSSNASADSKLVTYDVQNIADIARLLLMMADVLSAGAQYNLSVLTSDENISFSASVSSAEVSPLNDVSVHKAIAD